MKGKVGKKIFHWNRGYSMDQAPLQIIKKPLPSGKGFELLAEIIFNQLLWKAANSMSSSATPPPRISFLSCAIWRFSSKRLLIRNTHFCLASFPRKIPTIDPTDSAITSIILFLSVFITRVCKIVLDYTWYYLRQLIYAKCCSNVYKNRTTMWVFFKN